MYKTIKAVKEFWFKYFPVILVCTSLVAGMQVAVTKYFSDRNMGEVKQELTNVRSELNFYKGKYNELNSVLKDLDKSREGLIKEIREGDAKIIEKHYINEKILDSYDYSDDAIYERLISWTDE